MTEAEAKKKVCVFRLIGTQAMMAGQLEPKRADAIAVAINDAGMCIGSACMMWRWGDYPNPRHSPYMATTEPATFKSTTDGHCGIAGKP